MLFATSSLAARIDRAEHATGRIFTELTARRGTDSLVLPLGGTAALYSGPDQPWNKVVGLGFGDRLDDGQLETVEREFDRRGAAIRVEFSSLADGRVAALLSRRGYELIGFENVLGLALDSLPASPPANDVAITRVGPSELSTWIETVVEGFSVPDVFDGPPPTESFPREALVEVFQYVVDVPGMQMYFARRGGEIAGGGATRIVDGLAMLNGAATLAPHRRRGVQSALLHARLADARRAGCDLAVVTTEPGSKSQVNVQRVGFQLLYVRAILVRAPRAS